MALSGGLDSAGILAAARCVLGAQAELQAFTYAGEELPWAELVAAHCNAQLHRVEFDARQIPARMAQSVREQEMPFGSPVALVQAQLFRVAAAAGTEVLLGGHGPDMLFGGGASHRSAALAGALAGFRVGNAVAAVRGGTPGLMRLLRSALKRIVQGRTDLRALIDEQLHASVLPTSLRIEQQNAAAAGIEVRFPYLTAAMVELSRALPAAELGAAPPKRLLCAALRGLVPDEVLGRSGRAGFAVPVVRWLLELRPWVEESLGRLAGSPLFAGQLKVAELWPALERGDARVVVLAFRVWRWLSVAEWLAAFSVRLD